MSSVHFSHIIPLDPLEYHMTHEADELILIPHILMWFFFWSSQKILTVAGFNSVTANVSWFKMWIRTVVKAAYIVQPITRNSGPWSFQLVFEQIL